MSENDVKLCKPKTPENCHEQENKILKQELRCLRQKMTSFKEEQKNITEGLFSGYERMRELHEKHKMENECLKAEISSSILKVRCLRDRMEAMLCCNGRSDTEDKTLSFDDLVVSIEAKYLQGRMESLIMEWKSLKNERDRFCHLANDCKRSLDNRNAELAQAEEKLGDYEMIKTKLCKYEEEFTEMKDELGVHIQKENDLQLLIDQLNSELKIANQTIADERSTNARIQSTLDRLVLNMTEINSVNAADKQKTNDCIEHLKLENSALNDKIILNEITIAQQMKLLHKAIEVIKVYKSELNKPITSTEQQCAGEPQPNLQKIEFGCRPQTSDESRARARIEIDETLKRFEKYTTEFKEVAAETSTDNEPVNEL
ncbi:uncharacterized protein LOC126898159 [Daktulosphaira vitifoliae]|uniref:uncharacterized protein LOC126898159 n=1 Tax=Daktulosphaira vitifoliae TaxID=58002 RepID=UPI0021A97929|nr:uncharacterized protein LOC126898159 [Daktulosphaira vitifoliae]